ncbi:hypothetical protein FAGKG844_600018 [Frankia sp. AgKG'84/4]
MIGDRWVLGHVTPPHHPADFPDDPIVRLPHRCRIFTMRDIVSGLDGDHSVGGGRWEVGSGRWAAQVRGGRRRRRSGW